ncbi:MAG: alpha/beta hydrolase family protein [Gemmatimonadaceae bacterium]
MTKMRLRSAWAAVLLASCAQPLKLAKDDSPLVLNHQAIQAPNPGLPGPMKVRTLLYGSGNDKRRAAYRDSVRIKTKSVDGSAFVKIEGAQEKTRKKRWGFDVKQLPINGRVWYPVGDGPFPLVLVVHGNHDPYDYSDPGYDYLGELLASRGFILVSVDHNFINGLSNENDGRGWLLLEHLRAWRAFSDSSANPFYRKVDWRNLAVMGHSRGGEAVGHAVTFNRLERYPDDANTKLGYNFNIRAAVAIAPVDGQYRPAGRLHPFTDVNYLVIHGSHDGDVSTFHGLRQYERLRFTQGSRTFKAAVYVYRANHGQWNRVWRNLDNGKTSARRLALQALMPEEEQLKFGRVMIAAFLEATLKSKQEYLPLFVDHRTAGQWLPRTMYITRFEENRFIPLATFDDDVNVNTGAPGVRITGDSLSMWNENVVPFRWAGPPGGQPETQNNSAVWLGWNNKIAGDDTTRRGAPARYTLTLSDSLRSSLPLGDATALVLSVAPTNSIPGKRPAPKDTTKKDSAAAKPRTPRRPSKAPAAPRDTARVDFTIEVEDADGNTVRAPLSAYGVPRRPLETRVLRRARFERTAFRTTFEIVLQTYVIPLADLAKASPAFSPSKLRAIRLVFDRVDGGTVIVDRIGVSNIDPAFLASRVSLRASR